MKNNEAPSRKERIVSTISIFLVVLYKFLLTFKVEEIVAFSVLFAMFLLCFSYIIAKRKIPKKQTMRTFILSVPVLLISYITKSANLFLPILVAVASLKEERKYIAKVFGYSILSLSVVTIVLYEFGLLEDCQLYRGSAIRHSLGFIHPNALAGSITCGFLSLLYAYGIKKLLLCITISSVWIIYSIAYSNTALISIIMYIGFLIAVKIGNKNIFKYSYFLFPIFFILTIILSIIPENEVLKAANILLSDRIDLNRRFIMAGGLFHIAPNMIFLEKITIDNYYINLIIRLGIAGFFIYLLYNHKTLKSLSDDKKLMALVAVYAITTLSESTAMISSMNVVMSFQAINFIKGEYRKC